MEVAAAAAMAMDFHALPRRELQALCKRNGVRANMTNAAMADALQSLPSVDGIDEIGTTLCLPTPGRSTMKSALKAAAAIGEEEEQQHGSPLPRGRRVSVKSPEAIWMDVEEGEDEMKRDLGKEIVRTPGVALRSTSRRARATPAPIRTPAGSSVRATTSRTAAARKMEEAAPTPGTLRRSQRTAARKASAPVEEEVTTTKRTTRRSARSKVMIVLDQEVEDMAVALQEVKVKEEYPKDVAFNEKRDETEEEATKLLEEGNGKQEESEEGEEVVSSAAPTELAVVSFMSCDDPKEEEMAAAGEESAKTQEVEGVGKEQEPVSVVNSAPLPLMEDSPILGVLSKPEPVEPLSEKVEDASASDGLGFGELSAEKEITGEIDCASDVKEVDADEVPEEKLPADVTDDKTSEEDDLNAGKEVSAVEMPQADLTSDEEEDLNEVKEGRGEHEGAGDEMADLTESETREEDVLDDESADEASEEYASSEETDGESDPSEVATDSEEEEEEMLPVTMGDAEDDFSDAGNFSDAETESDTTLMASSAAKAAAVKSSDDDSVTEKLEASSEEVSQQEVEASLNSIVKSLDEFTFTVEGTQQQDDLTGQMKSSDDAEAVGAKELKEKLTVEDLNAKSLRKLKTMYKDKLIAKAAAEGKRLALAELDDNAGVDC